jgi:hypothetical protein
MSNSRARFTVRRLMIVVVVAAVLLAAFEAGRRWGRAERATVTFMVKAASKPPTRPAPPPAPEPIAPFSKTP